MINATNHHDSMSRRATRSVGRVVAVSLGLIVCCLVGANEARAECGDYVVYRGLPWLSESGEIDFEILAKLEHQGFEGRATVPFGSLFEHEQGRSGRVPCHGPSCGQSKPNLSFPPLTNHVRPTRDVCSWFIGAETEAQSANGSKFSFPSDEVRRLFGFPRSIERPPRAIVS